jgi:hypothetical protein
VGEWQVGRRGDEKTSLLLVRANTYLDLVELQNEFFIVLFGHWTGLQWKLGGNGVCEAASLSTVDG